MTLREAAKGVVTAYGGAYHIGFENPEIGEDQTMFSADNLKILKCCGKTSARKMDSGRTVSHM